MKLLSIYIFSLYVIFCYGYTRITNIKCESFNKDICTVSVCKLKVLGRGRVGANVRITNPSPPLKGATVNFSMWRKLNGYHPFLFNTTLDYCRFLQHPNPSNIFYYFHQAILPFSNLNHSCPYDVSRTRNQKRKKTDSYFNLW